MIAFGTVGAVVVAVGGPFIKGWWKKPNLKALKTDDHGPMWTSLPYFNGKGSGPDIFQCWLRFPIANEGRLAAKGTMVLVSKVVLPVAGRLPPTRELKWGDVEANSLTIPTNAARLVDIIQVVHLNDGTNGVFLCLYPYSNYDRVLSDQSPLWMGKHEGGEYRIEIAITANNAKTERYLITFRLNDMSNLATCKTELANATLSKIN
ncbi:hypothetical protein AB0950_17465 [Streptomyces sp. NPDC007189]|uniref:hypothetical protein n=1 Tax=Streptomyces sp. NPDC007189 TaxID=3154315 RepID=UPI00345513F9